MRRGTNAMQISLDTNIWIVGILGIDRWCEQILFNLSRFDVILPEQVREELSRHLSNEDMQQSSTVLNIRLDRHAFSVSSSFDTSEETRYWWAQSPEARLRHIERLRQINYGDQAAARLQRVLEIAPRTPALERK